MFREHIAAHGDEPNRGPHRHFLPMPFEPTCFAPEFFFDSEVLAIVRGIMGEYIVADQWGCDVPLKGSTYQAAHVDYQRPLFEETPDLPLPVYILSGELRAGPHRCRARPHRNAAGDARDWRCADPSSPGVAPRHAEHYEHAARSRFHPLCAPMVYGRQSRGGTHEHDMAVAHAGAAGACFASRYRYNRDNRGHVAQMDRAVAS
jgi:hypothetical protein